jgi:hypothetical protein
MITAAARQKISDLLRSGGYTGVNIHLAPNSLFHFTPFSGGSAGGIIVNADPLIVINEGALLIENLLIDYDAESREIVIRR